MLVKEVSSNLKQKIVSFNLVILFLILTSNSLFAQLIPAKTIPEFTFYKLTGEPFTQKQLKKEGKILFLFFDATCTHCQYEMQQIGTHYKYFQNTSFYIVSMDRKQQIENFMRTYGKELNGKNNVTVLMDTNRQFIQRFLPSQFPAVYIYNSNQQLLKYWDTVGNIDQILNIIYTK